MHVITFSSYDLKVVRVITFSSYDPLFKNLGLLKLFDIIRMSNLLFMHDFYKKKTSHCI